MKKCKFDNIIVIGCGKIAVTAIKYIASLKETYGFSLCFIQHEMQELTAVKKVCDEKKITFLSLPEKADVTQELLKYNTPTMIISAGNYYLFPKELLAKENITAINFHNALLPKYPGRNAPSWTIYYGEKESGATWHQVNESVDSGGIIWQKACEITPDMKAYELTAKIMELAQEGLEAFLEDLLENGVTAKAQAVEKDRKMYYSKDIPANGQVKITDDITHIYRTLRAMDYGKMGPFPPVTLKLCDGRMVDIIRYKKKAKELYNEEAAANNYVALTLDDENLLVLKYKEKE